MNLFTTLIKDPFYIRLIGAALVLFIFIIAKRILSKLVIKFLSKIQFKQKRLDIVLFDCLQKPFNYLFLFTGIYMALAISPFIYYQTPSEQSFILGELTIPISIISKATLTKYYSVIIIGIITWAIYDLEHIYEQLFSNFNMRVALIDNTLFIRYMARIIRFITVTIGVILILITLVPNLSTIITGVGIGGAAVAIISKDSIANIFSGMILLLDKPFVIGDWVELGTIEGIVEDISFRSTRIRTFTQGLVVIPNATIGNANITNWSRMSKRRVKFDLGVAYATSTTQLKTCITKIKNYLETHPDIEADTSLVAFENFGDYSLNIQIIYYVLKTDYPSYLAIKEVVNLELIAICDSLDISIAFPTQTLMIEGQNIQSK